MGVRATVKACLGIGLICAGVAQANPFETTLSNGMKVVVKEDHRASSVVSMVWYRAGSMDEVDGHSGLAHVLEHMMFKGTPHVPLGQFNAKISAMGGMDNAFTSYDYTAYFQQIPPKFLNDVMTLEADRMVNLNWVDDEFVRELAVVKEERRMRTDDQPRALVIEQLLSSAYREHSYRRPVIGWMQDLDAMRPNDARTWYKQWYAPNNATLVVVGDVTHEQVFDLARKNFGKIKARALPEKKDRSEPVQKGERRSIVKAPADLPYVALAWQAPTLRSPSDEDTHALAILAGILDGYEGARLSRELVQDKKIAVSVGAGYDRISRGPSLFILDGAPTPGHTVSEVETALREQIARIAAEGVSESELARVKAQVLAAHVYKQDSLMGQAMEIGSLESTGHSWQDEAALLEGLRKVSTQAVKAVAQKYFINDALTVTVLEPLPSNKPQGTANKPVHTR